MAGNIEIYGVTISRPNILIETDGSGGTNWSSAAAEPNTPPKSIENIIGAPEDSAPAGAIAVLDRLSIGRVSIADGTLSWRDGPSGREERIESLNVDARVPNLEEAVTIEGSFERLGVAQSFELEIGERPNPQRFESVPVALTLSSDAATMAVVGTALAGDRYFTGTIESNGESFVQFAKTFGLDLPNAPAFGEFQVAARVDASASQVLIEQYSVEFGGISARGGAAIGLDRSRPGIGLKFEADRIDTALFIENPTAGAGEAAPAGVAGSEMLDFSPLSMIDANIDFSVAELVIGAVPVTDLSLDVQIAGGGLRSSIRSANVNGAPGSGSLIVDTSGAEPAISGGIKMNGLDAAGLVALTGMELAIEAGAVDLDVAFTTHGDTQAILLENIDGSGRVSLANGHLIDLGLADFVGGDPAADQIDDVDIAAEFSSLSAPVTAKGEFNWRGERFTLSARGEPRKIAAGMTSMVTIDTTSNRANFGFAGDASLTGLGSGKFSLSTPSLRNLLAWTGQPLAPGGGLASFSIDGAVTLAEDFLSFESAAFTLDGSNGVGTGKVTFGGIPTVTAGLTMNRLDVTPYLTGGRADNAPAQSQSAGGTGRSWSDDRIAFDGLRAINANLNLRTDEIVADEIQIGPSNLTIKIADGALTAELTEMALYSGIGVGTLSIDGSSATPQLAAFFRLDGIEALGFLSDAIGFSRVEGTGAISFDIQTAGTSEAALMTALTGKGSVEFRDGAIRGINIPKMVRGLSIDTLLGWQQTSDEKTNFSELSGTYTISNGILTNSDLVLIGPLLRVTGAGTVDIPKQSLAYRIDPKIVASLQGQGGSQDLEGFAVPVRVEGPWDQPRIYPEIDGILNDPQKALDQLRKLGGGLFGGGNDLLGSSEGQSTQPDDGDGETIEDKLLNEAAKGLGNLFGGSQSGDNLLPGTAPPPPAAAPAEDLPLVDQAPLDLLPPPQETGEVPPDVQSADAPQPDLPPELIAPEETTETPPSDPATDLLNSLFGQ